MSAENKTIKTTIRLSEEEHAHLTQLAVQSYLNLSEYIRRRLFEEDLTALAEHEEPQSKFNCDHDQEVMRTLVRVLALTKSVAKQSLPQEDFQDAYAAAKQQLQAWGYE